MKILVVEDDPKVAAFIQQGLREEGYAVEIAKDGEEATAMARANSYNVILLDLMLPRKNGLDVASDLRKEGKTTPILMLTARDTTEDIVRGLDAGADDYLGKPFKFDELLARIRALVRRGAAAQAEKLVFGTIELNRLKHIAFAAGKKLDLTPREFQLLESFLAHPTEVVSRSELLQRVWGTDLDPESNVVDVHVGNLRRKLREAGCEAVVQTVRGIGFALQEASASEIAEG